MKLFVYLFFWGVLLFDLLAPGGLEGLLGG